MRWYTPSLHSVPRVSENCYLGVALRDVEQLYNLAKENKAVLYRSIWGAYSINPAQWMIHRQAIQVQEMINNKKLYFCVKKEDL